MRILLTILTLSFSVNPAKATDISVLADIPPVHSLISMVMEGLPKPQLIVRGQNSAHHHSLRPSEARKIKNASVIFWAGEALSPWLEDPIENLGSTASTVALLDHRATALLLSRDAHDHGLHDGQDEHAADEHGDDADEHATEHDHRIDPHAWLDPENAAAWVEVISEKLSALDPKNAQTYQDNSEKWAGRLRDFVAENPLEKILPSRVAVYHDAYQYFEFRFKQAPPLIIGASDATLPGAAQLSDVRSDLSSDDFACVLVEPGYNEKILDRLVENSSAKIVALDPLGSHLEAGPDLYLKLMTDMVRTYSDCNTQ